MTEEIPFVDDHHGIDVLVLRVKSFLGWLVRWILQPRPSLPLNIWRRVLSISRTKVSVTPRFWTCEATTISDHKAERRSLVHRLGRSWRVS